MGPESTIEPSRSRRAARQLVASTAVVLVLLLSPVPASADTTFGGDPAQAITPGLSCQLGAPTGFVFPEIFLGTQGSPSCMWSWSNPAVGTDIVPIPATGGSGTITSVTLPAMPNPGPMQVVVLTAALNATSEPSKPNSICCQVKQVGPTFTVPANQVTTVPQSLHVSATEEANLSQPGDTSFGDLLGISVVSPSTSLPIRYTGNNGTASVTNFDGDYVYYPAPGGANGEYQTPLDPVGFELLARFNLALDGAPTPGPAPGPAPTPVPKPAGANGGLKLANGPLQLGADGKTLTLGRATNPPTAGTTQTLTLPATARASASAKDAKKKATVVGSGKTTVPGGKTVPLKLRLNGKGRQALKHGSLHATLTIVAGNPQGEKQTTTRAVVVKPAPKKTAR